MKFEDFLARCKSEPTVSDFESYLAYRIFGGDAKVGEAEKFTVELYSYTRDQAFERWDEKAARLLYDLSGAAGWQEGEWEGALR
jgi:hypothetical protein